MTRRIGQSENPPCPDQRPPATPDAKRAACPYLRARSHGYARITATEQPPCRRIFSSVETLNTSPIGECGPSPTTTSVSASACISNACAGELHSVISVTRCSGPSSSMTTSWRPADAAASMASTGGTTPNNGTKVDHGMCHAVTAMSSAPCLPASVAAQRSAALDDGEPSTPTTTLENIRSSCSTADLQQRVKGPELCLPRTRSCCSRRVDTRDMGDTSAITRIVVPTDARSERHTASHIANDIATRMDGYVELLSVVGSHETAERTLELQAEARALGQRVACDVIVSADLEGRVEKLIEDPGVLVCLPSSGRVALSEAFVASISNDLLLKATNPVLVVGPHCEPSLSGSRLAIAVDGSESGERIVEPAVRFAQQLGLTPMVYQSLPPAASGGGSDILESTYVRRIAHKYSTADVTVQYDVLHDEHPGAALERLATDKDIAVIALASHGHQPYERLASPSITHRLIRHGACPVYVGLRQVPAALDVPENVTGDRVVVGVEGLVSDRSVLAVAADEAAIRGATLQLVHTWSAHWHYGSDGAIEYQANEVAVFEGQEVLDRLIEEASSMRPGVRVVGWLSPAFPADALGIAAEGASLVVVGQHQYSGVDAHLFGHVADGVIAKTRTPVLVVPERIAVP